MDTLLDIASLEHRLLHPDADLSYLSADEQYERIMAKVSDIPNAVVSPSDLRNRLRRCVATGTPLKIKFGIDPTGPDIHIGHAVSLLNLRLFQRLGHHIILVIGDFTGMIGDPSGRSDDRPALTSEDVARNMTTFEEQAARVIDLRNPRIERHLNSEWMSKLTMAQWAAMLKHVSVPALLQREDFRTRLAKGHGLSMAELEYALYMGYDSVALNCDVELGGVDQYLNMHMCRRMMEINGQTPEIIATYNLLAGTAGERDDEGRLVKMSKSRNNYVPIAADPLDMYGKVMSIPDDVMWMWYRELTEITANELEQLQSAVQTSALHPKDVKKLLARVLVATFNGFDEPAAHRAEQDFDSKFGKNASLIPDTTVEVETPPGTILDALAIISKQTKSAIRRLVLQRGIHVVSETGSAPLSNEDLLHDAATLKSSVVRIGKRQYFRLL
jgi:tyrosyl-tRNA synthetase